MQKNSNTYNYFMKAVNNISPKLSWNAKTISSHYIWRKKFESKLQELLGKMPKKVPLDVYLDEKIETKSFIRSKIYIRSEKDYWIPSYYFLPKNLKKKTPAIICLHGHSGILPYIREGTKEQKALGKRHSLDYAPFFAENGYITIAPIQRGWNETRYAEPSQYGDCYRVTMDAFLIGMTPIGVRVWDCMRIVDFLKTQDEVDKLKIGVAGLSGGGTTSLFLSAMDERIKLAMIAGYFCTFRDSIYQIFHCICNCVPHIMEWAEMSDIAALIAPRPLLIISGEKDPIFPIEGTKKAYKMLEKVYKMFGEEENLENDFFEGEHQWSNRKTIQFLKKHFI